MELYTDKMSRHAVCYQLYPVGCYRVTFIVYSSKLQCLCNIPENLGKSIFQM